MSKSKPWLKDRSKDKRKRNIRPLRDRILIVCGGEQTEKKYFEAFPVKKDVVIVDVKGIGADPITLLKKTLRIKDQGVSDDSAYNQVWLVIDKDDFPDDLFNNVINSAEANKVRVAYSNQAFELWYLLHFEFLNTSIDRQRYCTKLSSLLDHEYKKNDEDIYTKLKGKQYDAICRAKKLLGAFDRINPAKNDPSTTVHKLVECLNEFL